ncbi:MAG: hypothetical protein ACI915_000587 [Gammaproteobacteria bacterium]|jgi:hypothetical protein
MCRRLLRSLTIGLSEIEDATTYFLHLVVPKLQVTFVTKSSLFWRETSGVEAGDFLHMFGEIIPANRRD